MKFNEIEIPATVSTKVEVSRLVSKINKVLAAGSPAIGAEVGTINGSEATAAEWAAFWDRRSVAEFGVLQATESRAKKAERLGMPATAAAIRELIPVREAVKAIEVVKRAAPVARPAEVVVCEPGCPRQVFAAMSGFRADVAARLLADLDRSVAWFGRSLQAIAEAAVSENPAARDALMLRLSDSARLAAMTGAELQAEADRLAVNEIARFAVKIADRVGAFGEVVGGHSTGSSVNGFSLALDFADGGSILFRTSVRFCHTDRGVQFCQWPTLAYRGGKRLTLAGLAEG